MSSQAPLWDKGRHEALAEIAWDEARARKTIADIVARTVREASGDGSWPVHPDDGKNATYYMLYFGAAGVLWALNYLADVGAAEFDRKLNVHLLELREKNRGWLAKFMPECPSLLMGEAGFLATQWRIDKSPRAADELAEMVAENAANPALELMWGAPGTMISALTLHEATGEDRWADLFRESAAELEAALLFDEGAGCWLWEQDLYGRKLRHLGAVHGFAGNAYPIIRGMELLAPASQAMWRSRIAETLERTALRQDGCANWRPQVSTQDGHMMVQHCHGAPGMVVGLSELVGIDVQLLAEAGETVWRAGPLRKGSNLCHGTGGNGYAFLKLFERTGNEMWLGRARSFAMHAIAQCEAATAQHGMGRHSLWTGDPGLACYLWDCIRGKAGFPTMDVL